MRVVVPFGAAEPKTRLAPVLDAAERRDFARVMLADVLEALVDAGCEPTVVADEPIDLGTLADEQADLGTLADESDDSERFAASVVPDVSVTVDERPLTDAVNARLPADADEESVAVVMADLALATPAALDRLFAPEADVVLAPGRGGGTNAVVARHPEFCVDYHGASIRDHRGVAADIGASLATADSYRLATDVDEPDDLVEVLLHAGGRAGDWLRGQGFAVAASDGRVEARRDESGGDGDA